jgi:GNAT superfamily N-acetyltransferase
MTIALRPADLADIDSVGDVHHRARVDAYRPFLPDDAFAGVDGTALAAWWRERWTYERETNRLTVAVRDGQVVGFTYVGPDEDGQARLGMLYAIHVDPDHQGGGVGRALMSDAQEAIRAAGYPRAALWVLERNERARRFYERGGWSADGQEREDSMGSALVRQLRYARALT